MNFIRKPKLQINNIVYFPNSYQKPSTCPFCGIDTDATLNSVNMPSYRTKTNLYIISLKCTHCKDNFVALYEGIQEGKNERLDFIEVLPRSTGAKLPTCLSKISPRFAEVHKEAEGAENFGFTDLAAIGYRKALEILVKDYAISELGISEDEVISKKLEKAIELYLKQKELVNTADVVRLLANDYTHYKEKFPDFDFSLLKHYYEIFLHLIVTEYEIKHPPVARQQSK